MNKEEMEKEIKEKLEQKREDPIIKEFYLISGCLTGILSREDMRNHLYSKGVSLEEVNECRSKIFNLVSKAMEF